MNVELPKRLAERLAGPLPGPEAISRFVDAHRGVLPIDPPTDAREAAVLILLYPREGQWHVPLTLRPASLADHAGQISLPGGAVEPGETSAAAAIREFHEELGAADMAVDLVGRLSPRYVMASRFRVEPWVGVAPRRGRLVPDPAEVDELLEVPLAHLMDPAHFGSHQHRREGRVVTVPHFQWQSHRIWGATCMILGEFVTLLAEANIEV
jgi:8-oxo-dGTP pyrophosphatase MutT (NUDIX family)